MNSVHAGALVYNLRAYVVQFIITWDIRICLVLLMLIRREYKLFEFQSYLQI